MSTDPPETQHRPSLTPPFFPQPKEFSMTSPVLSPQAIAVTSDRLSGMLSVCRTNRLAGGEDTVEAVDWLGDHLGNCTPLLEQDLRDHGIDLPQRTPTVPVPPASSLSLDALTIATSLALDWLVTIVKQPEPTLADQEARPFLQLFLTSMLNEIIASAKAAADDEIASHHAADMVTDIETFLRDL